MQYLEYLAAAYALMWAAVLVYVLFMARRERAIWTELRALRDAVSGLSDRPGE